MNTTTLDRPIKLTDDDFDRVIAESTVPVVVDFYADWCGPCRIMVPVFEELAASWKGRVLIAKVDTDHAPRVSGRFGIRGIPTFIVFKNGKEVARQSGAVPKAVVEQLFSRFV